MRSKIELLAQDYCVSLKDGSVALQLDPKPNWYGEMKLTDPINPKRTIEWGWSGGKIPKVTTPTDINEAGIYPTVKGNDHTLLAWGHRWIKIDFPKENVVIVFHNFDPVE